MLSAAIQARADLAACRLGRVGGASTLVRVRQHGGALHRDTKSVTGRVVESVPSPSKDQDVPAPYHDVIYAATRIPPIHGFDNHAVNTTTTFGDLSPGIPSSANPNLWREPR